MKRKTRHFITLFISFILLLTLGTTCFAKPIKPINLNKSTKITKPIKLVDPIRAITINTTDPGGGGFSFKAETVVWKKSLSNNVILWTVDIYFTNIQTAVNFADSVLVSTTEGAEELAISSILSLIPGSTAIGIVAGICFFLDSAERGSVHDQITNLAFSHNGRVYVTYAYSTQNGSFQGDSGYFVKAWDGSFYNAPGYVYSINYKS